MVYVLDVKQDLYLHISEFHTYFPSMLCHQAVIVTHAGFLECLQSVSHEQTLQEDYDYAEPWPTL